MDMRTLIIGAPSHPCFLGARVRDHPCVVYGPCPVTVSGVLSPLSDIEDSTLVDMSTLIIVAPSPPCFLGARARHHPRVVY